MVDILRGKDPLPIDFEELKNIKEILKINDEEFFNLWENIFIEYLEKGGFDKKKNEILLNSMLICAKNFALKKD